MTSAFSYDELYVITFSVLTRWLQNFEISYTANTRFGIHTKYPILHVLLTNNFSRNECFTLTYFRMKSRVVRNSADIILVEISGD